jgi:PBS lyase HEAT-like repeat
MVISDVSEFQPRIAIGKFAAFIALVAAVPSLGQQRYPLPQPSKLAYAADLGNVPDAIAKVKSGNICGVCLELIANADAVEAIPVLEDQFTRAQDPMDKEHLASVLVRLGAKDETYWNSLVDNANRALDLDPPDPFSYGPDGKPQMKDPPSSVMTWAKDHNLSLSDAGEQIMFRLPAAIIYLGASGDPRGGPLLRRALLSTDPMIQAQAALGLAQIKDEGAVPLIIEACKRASPDSAGTIARALVFFDDRDAQDAVNRYLPQKMAELERGRRLQGEMPFGGKPLKPAAR